MSQPIPPAVQSSPLEGDFEQDLLALQPRLRAFLRKLLVSLPTTVVEDLMQETYTRAWRFRAQFDATRGSLDAWLMRIGFRTFLDVRSQMRRQPASQEALPIEVEDGQQLIVNLESRERLSRLLLTLTPTERTILLMFHSEGQSVAVIGEALSLPAGTVKSHLHRARQRMWDLDRADRAREDM